MGLYLGVKVLISQELIKCVLLLIQVFILLVYIDYSLKYMSKLNRRIGSCLGFSPDFSGSSVFWPFFLRGHLIDTTLLMHQLDYFL